MLERSTAYHAAITGAARRILLKAVIDISDPDQVLGEVTGSEQAAFSKPEQLHDRVFVLGAPYATLERNRWLLNGAFDLLPDDLGAIDRQVGGVSQAISGEDGTFGEAQVMTQSFSGVSILQACGVYFPDAAYDGVPADFTVEVLQGGTAYHRADYTGNTADHVNLTGFTVYDPDAIRVTVTRWSLPGRRMRLAEILPGVYEEWGSDIIASFDVKQQASFSCLTLPYGTCTLSMDNLDRRFEPRNKQGIFKSIEERQGIDVSIGVELEAGGVEYKHVGVFYQYSGGWKTGDNGLTMQWDLADIVGLLAGREFVPPDTLPTTLAGWFAALAAQLGDNFADLWHVDPDYAELAVTANSAEDIAGATCGEIMRWACMATGTWPRADAETGALTAEPFWYEGAKLDLDNMVTYPVMKANNDLAAIIFTLADGSNTQYIVSGNATSSSETVSVQNPFIHDQAAALTAAKLILSTYGGNQLEATGRGDPASEIGDVDTVWLNESTATTGRRQYQTFQIQNGVLQNCRSTLLQADGSFQFEERAVITASGSWTAPAGVSRLRLILVGRGGDGTDGEDGTWDAAGADGQDGEGALVWAGTVDINEGQVFEVSITDEGTTFGSYSAANGKRYAYGYTDVASGDSFARTGVKAPVAGSGDGGAGGRGGVKGNRHYEYNEVSSGGDSGSTDSSSGSGFDTGGSSGTVTPSDGVTWSLRRSTAVETTLVVDNYPGKGQAGVAGVTGCVVVYWDKEG